MDPWAVAVLGSTPIGGPIVGAISENLGGRWGLAVGAIACCAAGAFGMITLHGRHRHDKPAPACSAVAQDRWDGALDDAVAPHGSIARRWELPGPWQVAAA